MQDALPRLDDAFDGSKRNGMDRRQLLKMGAWAAPVIVLATAAPAAAAQSASPPAQYTFSANPGVGRLAPDLIYASSSVTTNRDYWSASGGFTQNLYVHAAPSTFVILRWRVPSDRTPLSSFTTEPAGWKFLVGSKNNVVDPIATWRPDRSNPRTGYWEVSLTTKSWSAGATGYYLPLTVKSA